MIHWWVVIGDVVGQVGGPRSLIVVELILIFMAPDPVKTYARLFGAFGHYGVVCDTS